MSADQGILNSSLYLGGQIRAGNKEEVVGGVVVIMGERFELL